MPGSITTHLVARWPHCGFQRYAGPFPHTVTGTGGQALLLSGTNVRIVSDWSRDGATIFFFEGSPATIPGLVTLAVTADGKVKEGAKPQLYLSTPAKETWPRFSPEPNPRWAAYQSDESGKNEVYIDSFPERRGAVQVSNGGGTYPQWGPISGDRSELFYVSGDSWLMAAELRLVQGRVEASPPHKLFALAPAEVQAGSSPYDTAPDGQRFLVRTPVDTVRPLTVVANWPALLKQVSGTRVAGSMNTLRGKPAPSGRRTIPISAHCTNTNFRILLFFWDA